MTILFSLGNSPLKGFTLIESSVIREIPEQPEKGIMQRFKDSLCSAIHHCKDSQFPGCLFFKTQTA